MSTAVPAVAMTARYALTSTRLAYRNVRFLVLTVALPLLLFLLYANLYQGQDAGDGLTVVAYLMVSMASFGCIGAAINTGARIAIERQVGWNRQLRLTALPGSSYLVAKAIVSMLVTLPALLLVFLAGATIGAVQLTAGQWIGTGFAVWLGLIPFAVLGLVIGFAGTVDTVQPISMITYLGLSILGGLWFPVEAFPAFLQQVAKVTPSYWLADLGRSVLAGQGVPVDAVLVLAAWTLVLGVVGVWAYRRSGSKV
ncbi:ABC transporter permease [Nakamurella sp.]|uniref:ABC transporter permease n=1 Tax=Nakamurella sp. TaxID=1869182 RepID=UPI0037832913